MASGLIGISVAVTLQNPPNTVVQGTVAAVNSQTSTLTLQDGEFITMASGDSSQTNTKQSFFQRPDTVCIRTMSKGTRSQTSRSTLRPLLLSTPRCAPILRRTRSILPTMLRKHR